MILEKLKTAPKNLYLLIITVAAFLLFILINFFIFGPLSAASPVFGILDLEFAWTVERVQLIFTTWGYPGDTSVIQLHIAGVYWDMLYIIGYGLFIFGCIVLVSRRFEGNMLTVGLYISLTPLIAGLCDVIENINLLIMLYNPTSFPAFTPLITGIFASIKFGLLFLGIIFFFVALAVVVIKLILPVLRRGIAGKSKKTTV